MSGAGQAAAVDAQASGSGSAAPVLAVLGTGVMGTALLAGAVKGGWSGERILAADANPEHGAQVAREHGTRAVASVAEAVAQADVVLVAVKPKDVAGLLETVSSQIRPGTLLVTIAAGLPISFFESRLPVGTPIVRAMPNTPAQIGAGVIAISPSPAAGEAELETAERLFSGSGVVVRVPEKDQDAVSALSGSGPAYVFYVVDALSEAGVLLGLTRKVALQLATQTVLGSARLLDESGDHPALLRERVSSPGGTTVQALRVLDERAVRAAFVDALQAAWEKSAEIGRSLAD